VIDTEQEVRQKVHQAGEKSGNQIAVQTLPHLKFLHRQTQVPESPDTLLLQKKTLTQEKNPLGRPPVAALP
jgi:hypothetical protein